MYGTLSCKNTYMRPAKAKTRFGGIRHGTRLLFLAVLLFLGACSARVELFSAISEPEANEILAVLLDSGISAEKDASKAGFAISVDSEQAAQALEILRSRGLPRESFTGMGQIFQKEGLVSSPLEERARYIYALSQELANTLSQMDGVLTSRVHVVLPERGGLNEAAIPSTAAVFIKHQPGYSLDALKPQMRRLVTHAIPGLTEDRVSIVLVSAQPGHATPATAPGLTRVLGLQVSAASANTLASLILLLVLLVLALGGLSAWLLYRQKPGFLQALGSRGGKSGNEQAS